MDAEQAQFRIDPEIESLIQPLTADEFQLLEQSILEWGGCRDKAVVWDEESILLDGHHRKRICDANRMLMLVERRSFPDRDAAKLWVLKNQLARRNLTAYQKATLALKMEPLLAAEAKRRQVSAGKKELVPKSAQAKTRDQLAEIAGVGHDTIAKVKLVEKHGTDALKAALQTNDVSINAAAAIVESGTAELQEALASGSLSPKEAKRLALLKPAEQRAKLESASKVPAGPGKTKPRSDVWPIGEVVDRADDCLRVWSRVCHYGKLYDASGKVNERAVRKLFTAFKPRMGDVALWSQMVANFLGPLKIMQSLAAAELGEKKKRKAG